MVLLERCSIDGYSNLIVDSHIFPPDEALLSQLLLRELDEREAERDPGIGLGLGVDGYLHRGPVGAVEPSEHAHHNHRLTSQWSVRSHKPQRFCIATGRATR